MAGEELQEQNGEGGREQRMWLKEIREQVPGEGQVGRGEVAEAASMGWEP